VWILLRYPFLWFLIGLVAALVSSIVLGALVKHRWRRVMICATSASAGGLLALLAFVPIVGAEIGYAELMSGIVSGLGFNTLADRLWPIFAVGFLSSFILTGVMSGAWLAWWKTRE
jgi:hypothetical protein